MATNTSLYEVLGIPMSASCNEVKAAYRRLARTFHPDVAVNSHNEMSSANDQFIRIHAAYSTLSDPDKRANYDRDLYSRRGWLRTSAVTAAAAYGCYGTGKNWETDQCW